MSKLLTCLLFISASLFAYEVPEINSKLKEVRLFQPGATLFREASINLKAGEQELLFVNLAVGIDPNSIQLYTDEKLEILSFQVLNQSFEDQAKPKEYTTLLEEIKKLRLKEKSLNREENVLRAEISMLNDNRQIGGNNGYSLQELKSIGQYYTARLASNLERIDKITVEKQALNLQIQKLEIKAQELKARIIKLRSAILIKVNSPKDLLSTIGLSYSYRNLANWSPVYRMSFQGLDQKLQLQQLANIQQSTGEDWTDIKISLSTGSPNSNNQLPILSPQYVNLFLPEGRRDYLMSTNSAPVMRESMETKKVASFDYRASAPQQLETRTDYSLNGSYSLKNGNVERFAMREVLLTSTYHFESVPKLDPSVFLMATVKGADTLQLLPGEVSVFNQGAYGGKFYQSFTSGGEDLVFSLGKDQNFNIERERIFKESRSSLFGGTIVEEHHYRIKASHNKKTKARLIIKDQIPFSASNDLKVKILNIEGAKLDGEKRFLEWNISLDPKEKRALDFKYSLSYPKGQEPR